MLRFSWHFGQKAIVGTTANYTQSGKKIRFDFNMSASASMDMVGATLSESSVPGRTWDLRKYSWRDGSNWRQVDSSKDSLRICTQLGQLLVVQNAVALESHPLLGQGQMHGVVKRESLLIVARHQNSARKFRVLFTSLQASKDCVSFLRAYFPVKDVSKPDEKVPTPVSEMYHRLVQQGSVDCLPNPQPIPADFELRNAVRMCILDPTFPELVAKVAASIGQLDIARK